MELFFNKMTYKIVWKDEYKIFLFLAFFIYRGIEFILPVIS